MPSNGTLGEYLLEHLDVVGHVCMASCQRASDSSSDLDGMFVLLRRRVFCWPCHLHFARQSAGLEPAPGGQDERRRARPAPQSDAEHPFPPRHKPAKGPWHQFQSHEKATRTAQEHVRYRWRWRIVHAQCRRQNRRPDGTQRVWIQVHTKSQDAQCR